LSFRVFSEYATSKAQLEQKRKGVGGSDNRTSLVCQSADDSIDALNLGFPNQVIVFAISDGPLDTVPTLFNISVELVVQVMKYNNLGAFLYLGLNEKGSGGTISGAKATGRASCFLEFLSFH
jgi:hypothetical protein